MTTILPADRTAARPPRDAAADHLALALQGGGSFGAFTWGVLDRLLSADIPARLEGVSGASAGAINAVLLAAGLMEGGAEAARTKLARFWRHLSDRSAFGAFGPLGEFLAASTAPLALPFADQFSPYQFNPFGLDPLRDLLEEEVDFARLRRERPLALLIAATRVRDGRARIFREDEITVDAVLASACLPQLHQAVKIDGEDYWDGGYSANPPLRDLILETRAEHVLVVQLSPEEHGGTPRLPADIHRRTRDLAFAAPLRRELEAIEELRALSRMEAGVRSPLFRRFEALRLHRIAAHAAMPDLVEANPADVGWSFLSRLSEVGHGAAGAWAAAHLPLAEAVAA